MSGAEQKRPWPEELRFSRADRALHITFDDGSTFDLPAEYLRVMSPSAEVKGHGAEPRKLITGKENVGFLEPEPVGNYAVRIRFDDGHDTGLYSWDYLYKLGAEQERLWMEYLEARNQP
jgi:DUF971 family protein